MRRAGRTATHHDLRRAIEAVVWRCRNGAKWRSVPAERGPWRRAAQTFIRWGRLRLQQLRAEGVRGAG